MVVKELLELLGGMDPNSPVLYFDVSTYREISVEEDKLVMLRLDGEDEEYVDAIADRDDIREMYDEYDNVEFSEEITCVIIA